MTILNCNSFFFSLVQLRYKPEGKKVKDRFSPLYLVMNSHIPLIKEAKKQGGEENKNKKRIKQNEWNNILALIISQSTVTGKAGMLRAQRQQQC